MTHTKQIDCNYCVKATSFVPAKPALAGAGSNARPRRGAPLNSDFVTSSCSFNRVMIVGAQIYSKALTRN